MQSTIPCAQATSLLQGSQSCSRRHACTRIRCSREATSRPVSSQQLSRAVQTVQSSCFALALSCLMASSSHAAEPAEVFQRSGCVGCHAGGGNIVQGGASLQTNDLQKNGAATTDAIYKLVYYGKGKMPGYGKECSPRGKCTFGPRIPDEDIQRLSQYVLDQAALKWK